MAVVKIGDILKERGLATENQIRIAIIQQRLTGDLLGDVFVKLGFVSAKELAQALAEQMGMEFIDLAEYPVSEEALRKVPRDLAENAGFIPIDLVDGTMTIGVTNPSNVLAIDKVTGLVGKHPKVYIVDADSYRESLERGYFFLENPIEVKREKIISEVRETEAVTGQTITSLVDLILMDGIRRNATDIHITPMADIIHVFYRIDGVLHYGHGLPKIVHSGVVSRIKVLAGLDIAETRLPQDGSFTFEFFRKDYDLRVSTLPTIYGENVVMRVLTGSSSLHRIDRLGFEESEVRKIRHLFHQPNGIILMAGPTGAGKTTTLYAALREVNLLERNVLTIEDPVEFRLTLAKQGQVNVKAGYDFALAARNFMRSDPDVLVIGEVRDEETAMIAIRASITGHLVLSTLHTNDAITSIPRLLDLKLDRFLLSSSLLAIIAQRLVRKSCNFCKVAYSLSDEELKLFRENDVPVDKVYKGQGCGKCNGTGYAGRLAIGEIFVIDDEIRDLIYTDAAITRLHASAIRKGMVPMKRDALLKVAAGATSLEEVLRVTG
ncbi:MAG: type II/IV secretion system protein [Deltaproteobacteria bacterium]|nr:type II/IV secretion system protein [Deltaproteobacteria bacterium]